jgi:hypothetical protein
MKFAKSLVALILLGMIGLSFQGCVTGMRAVNSGVTTLPNYLSGNLVPMTTFSTSDIIRFYVSFTWDDVTQEAGSREVTWNWYKDGKLIGHRENDRAYFRSAPNTRFATQPASALGTGHFRAECLIDGQQVAFAEFDIR